MPWTASTATLWTPGWASTVWSQYASELLYSEDTHTMTHLLCPGWWWSWSYIQLQSYYNSVCQCCKFQQCEVHLPDSCRVSFTSTLTSSSVRAKSALFKLSSSCSGVLAPMMTEDTPGLCSNQAMATCTTVPPKDRYLIGAGKGPNLMARGVEALLVATSFGLPIYEVWCPRQNIFCWEKLDLGKLGLCTL